MENQLSRRRTVPVLYARGNIHYIARALGSCCRFAPFLAKPSGQRHADENLPAAAFYGRCQLFAAAGLERGVVNADLLGGKGARVAFAR